MRLDQEAENQIVERAIRAEQRGELTGPKTFNWSVNDKELRQYKVRVQITPTSEKSFDVDYTVDPPSSGIGRRFTYTLF
jgi:hypothetical protein